VPPIGKRKEEKDLEIADVDMLLQLHAMCVCLGLVVELTVHVPVVPVMFPKYITYV